MAGGLPHRPVPQACPIGIAPCVCGSPGIPERPHCARMAPSPKGTARPHRLEGRPARTDRIPIPSGCPPLGSLAREQATDLTAVAYTRWPQSPR
jgi:hypothetical protein